MADAANTGRIVSIGEGMVEVAPLDDGGTFRMAFSGDTLNTAWYLARLLPPGWQVDYATAAGTDALSDRFVTFLASSAIGTGHVQRRQDRTLGLYLIELQNGERSFAYWRGESAARTLADDPATLAAALTGARLVYTSGITLAVVPPAGRRALLAALAAVRTAGGTVAFDPNLRPRLWPDADTMRAAVMAAAAAADIALPSHEDEAAFFGDATPEATARRYAQAGVGTVIVKNGPGEVVALHDGALFRHSVTPAASVTDTTAAGDSFNAGVLADLLSGAPLADAIATGARIAARVVGARGALIGAATEGERADR